jgi:predicted ATPase/class 3 adenylate cyclase
VDLPTGTVTFLFTDLETSTRNWEEQPDGVMRDALARHDVILRDAVESHRGIVFSSMGDGIAAVFTSAPDAVAAALDAQRNLLADEWGERGILRARMGLHTDEGRLRAPDQYENRPLNRCARLMSVAHGGQILISGPTEAVVGRALPPNAGVVDLGEHRLRDVAEPIRVFQVVHPSIGADFPPLRSLTELPGNLPRQVTSFVGREREMTDLTALVCERQLVTLTGVGGVGKTRLALEVAAAVAPEFRDGTWLCELAPVADPDAVWDTLATSLGVQRNPSRPIDAVVVDYLSWKRLLIVLDNCEHLLDATARVVDTIARRSADVAVLATSREGLAVGGEQLVAVPALGVPRAEEDRIELGESDAVRLFVDRARDAKSDFSLTTENADAVAQLCRRLDGIPLAIELAAARVRSLTPDDLVARLDQRFRLLTRGSRAALERHQTLRNTIDWSYNLLDDDEKLALERLSVFAGGCDLDAAEAVLAPAGDFDAIDVLTQLVDKSLVAADDDAGGRRYRLLETIRQYAQDRLEARGEAAAARRDHAEYFLGICELAGPHLRSRDQLEWAAKMTGEVENIRAALDWAVEAESVDLALRLVAPLMVTAINIGWTSTDWAYVATSIPGAADHPLFPYVVAFAALGAAMRNELERSESLVATAQAAQEALGTDHLWVDAASGVLAQFKGDADGVTHYAMLWLDGARERNDPYEISNALTLLAHGLHREPEKAAAAAEEAVRVARAHGIPSALLYALISSGILPTNATDPARVVDEAVEVARSLGDRQGEILAESFRGTVATREQNWPVALRSFADSAAKMFDYGETAMMMGCFWWSSFALCRIGELEHAAVVLGFSSAHFPPLSDPETTALRTDTEAMLRDGLGEEEVAELRTRGAEMATPDAVALLQEAAAALDVT